MDKGRGERRRTQQNKIDPWHCQEHSTALKPCSQFFDLSHHLLRPPPSPIPTHHLCRSFDAVVVTHCSQFSPLSTSFVLVLPPLPSTTPACVTTTSPCRAPIFPDSLFSFLPLSSLSSLHLLHVLPLSRFSFRQRHSLTPTYGVLSLDLLHWDDVRNIKSQHIKWIIVWEVDPLHRSLSPATISIIGFSYMSIKNCIHPMKGLPTH